MNSFLICSVSIILFILAISTIDNKVEKAKAFILNINKSYSKIINSQGRFIKALLIIVIIAIMFQMFIMSYSKIIDITGQVFSVKIIILTMVLFLFVFICMYFLFGIPLLIVSKFDEIINKIKNIKISFKLIISFSIIIFYSFFLFIAKDTMLYYKNIVFIGLAISYMLNFQMLINIIIDPLCFFIKEKINKDDRNLVFKITMSGAIILLILIILNLFLCVVMVSYSYENAYFCSISGHSIDIFDLFYYTIISFTTIGYGDIVPQIFQSKLISVIISFTSVLCLVIAVGSVLSVKDKLKDEVEEDIDNKSINIISEQNLIQDKRLNKEIVECIENQNNKLSKEYEYLIKTQNLNINLLKMYFKTGFKNINENMFDTDLISTENLKNRINKLKSNIDDEFVAHVEQIKIIEQLRDQIKKLNSFQEIDIFAKKINCIAEQTKFIGLNASIEAAKADKNEKSFAIVANEINKISNNLTEVSKAIYEMRESVKSPIDYIIKEFDKLIGINMDANKHNLIISSIDNFVNELEKCYALFNYNNSKFEEISKSFQSVIDVINKENLVCNIAVDLSESKEV